MESIIKIQCSLWPRFDFEFCSARSTCSWKLRGGGGSHCPGRSGLGLSWGAGCSVGWILAWWVCRRWWICWGGRRSPAGPRWGSSWGCLGFLMQGLIKINQESRLECSYLSSHSFLLWSMCFSSLHSSLILDSPAHQPGLYAFHIFYAHSLSVRFSSDAC